MPCRFPALLLAALLAAAPLAGCGDAAQKGQRQKGQRSTQSVSQARQAVRQQYDAETVEATLRRQNGASRLEVILVNPSGREATTQQSARAVGGTARAAYGGALDTVRVSFEYSSKAGPAEVGFHRRYTFSPGDLEGAADTTAAASGRDSTTADTAATSRQP